MTMMIKPSGNAYFAAGLLVLGIGTMMALCVHIVAIQQYDYFWFYAVPLVALGVFYSVRHFCLICKTVELCPEGYRVSFLGVQRLYAWEKVKIKSIEDCTKVIGRRNTELYPECLLLSVHKTKRPRWCNPVEFCVFTHPFSNVYACFKPEKEGMAILYGTVEVIVIDKQELLDTLQAYGVELDPAK